MQINIENLESKGKKYAIQISDTVLIRKEASNLMLTGEVSRKYEDVSYSLQDNDESDENENLEENNIINDTGMTRTRRTRAKY